MSVKPKLICIVGATASGKTGWGIELSKIFNGEVVSADSRQIYKKMDIGTAKPKRSEKIKDGYVVEGVPHHLIDVVDPGEEFTLAEFKQQATSVINDIVARGKVPFLVGGTGLYVRAVIDNLDIPSVAPNKKLRRSFETKTLPELVALLANIDPETVRVIDIHNPRRVIRALEVAITTGESFLRQQKKNEPLYETLQLGVEIEREKLYERIDMRIDAMMAEGMLKETKKLLAQKYVTTLPSMSSIGYRELTAHLQGKITLDEAVDAFKKNTHHYARRQLTWFRKDKRIEWVPSVAEAVERVRQFIS